MDKEYAYTKDSVIELCKTYMTDDDIMMLEKAYDLAEKAHEGQYRKNGLPFILHPVQVAGILAELTHLMILLKCLMKRLPLS